MLKQAIIICLLAVANAASYGQEPKTKDRVELLVSQLVSPNDSPVTKGSSARYDANYDKEAQKDVLKAYSALCDLGPTAFPYLFEHFKDNRYSLTADGGAADVNFTVGSLCFSAIDLQLQPYGLWTHGEGDPRHRPRRPHYMTHAELNKIELANAWWESRKGRTLLELQTEVLEWIYAEESKDTEKYLDSERKWIADTLKSIKKSRKSLRRGVPWAR